MSFADYASYDGLGLAELVRKKELTPLEVLDAAIERIERHNGTLNAVVYKAYDEARETAKGPLPDGAFKGVPFLIKDLGVRVKGWPRTSGSKFACVDADVEDTEIAKRYRASGVVLAGKTNTPEFGIPGVTTSARLGPCRNPWNPDHISGGSSGGAASAVASGMVPLAHASDGLGSIRIPAACCGLVGMKTTRDRNPNGQHDTDRAIGFSVDHVVSRSVRDSAAMLDATGYPEPGSPFAYPSKERPYLEEVSRAPGKLRIAFSDETASGKPIAPEMRAALESTAETLRALGHDVREEGLGIDYRTLYRAQAFVSAGNLAASMKRWIEIKGREPGDDIEGLARRGYEAGKKLTAQDAMWGWQQLRQMNRQILAKFETWDVWDGVLARPDVQAALRMAARFDEAVAAEREACAKIAEAFDIEGVRNHGSFIARQIRSQVDLCVEPPAARDKNTLYCSFCGKSQYELRLVVGPTVFICEECVGLAVTELAEYERGHG